MSKLRTVAPRKSARVLERTSCWTEQRHSTILFVQFWAEYPMRRSASGRRARGELRDGGARLGSYDDAVPANPVAFCSHIRERATRSRVQQLAPAHVRTGWR